MALEDIAQDTELKQWELNNQPRSTGPTRFAPDEPGYGPAECKACCDEMPVERREWGFKLCVPCKQLTEPRRHR